MEYLGIDPGKGGGIARVAADGEIISLQGMPESEHSIWQAIAPELYVEGTRACIEIVSARPGDGVAGMFKFGLNYGFCRACLVAAGYEWEDVQPVKWQREFGIPKVKNETYSDRKKRLRNLALNLWPNVPKEKGRITHKTCDALLIANWLREKYEL